MFPDCIADKIYFSGKLASRYRTLYNELIGILSGRGIKTGIIKNTKDIWCRDYMPLQVNYNSFVQFKYYPDYLRNKKYRHLITRFKEHKQIPEIKTCEFSHIILDGGNIVRWQDQVIMTDKIFTENKGIQREKLLDALQRRLRIEKIIIIPREPGDMFGHADGVVRFIDEKNVVINDYRKSNQSYGKRLEESLEKAGLKCVKVPYIYTTRPQGGICPTYGNYVNFLQAKGIIILPIYGIKQDATAIKLFAGIFPGISIKPVNCRVIAIEGGVLNCISWNIVSKSL